MMHGNNKLNCSASVELLLGEVKASYDAPKPINSRHQ